MREGRFSSPAAEIAQRYSESVSFDRRLYRHDLAGSIAHAAALASAGILAADAISRRPRVIISNSLYVSARCKPRFCCFTKKFRGVVRDRDFAADFLYNLAMIGIHLSRFSEDLIIWSTSEFGVIEFSEAFARAPV